MAVFSDARRITHASLVRVRPKPDRAEEAAEFLDDVLALASREAHTETSFLMRLGSGCDVVYGFLDLFTDELARREHLAGAARQAIAYRTRDLFSMAGPDALLDVLDHHLPSVAGRRRLAAGSLMTFEPSGTPSPAESVSAAPTISRAWLVARIEGGPLCVVDLTDGARDSASLPPVVRLEDGPIRLVSAQSFDLIGPDAPVRRLARAAAVDLRAPDQPMASTT